MASDQLALLPVTRRFQFLEEGDVADVCRLTCLEQGVQVVNADTVPQLEIVGLKVLIDWNGSPNGQKSVNSETFYSENPSSEGNHSA